MSIYFHEEDLPEGALGPGAVAVDTETMGLNPLRDRLCVVQISDGSGDEHLVRFKPGSRYDAPVLKAIFTQPIQFVKNLVRAAKEGFASFALHFLEHLKDAMRERGWALRA